jgi:ArsR family transcriptional regulator
MGELVAGTPALRLTAAVSLPLDLVSILSLLYRAVPGSSLDPWLIEARRSLPDGLRADLDLLHGFSGRLLSYVEEPVLRFAPLDRDRLDTGADDLFAYLDRLPDLAYREMAAHALNRVHRDLGLAGSVKASDDEAAWRRALEPALTTAAVDEVLPLLANPDQLKARTVSLFRGVWNEVYREDYAERLPDLREAARLAEQASDRGFGLAFADLTGNRPPATLVARLGEVDRVAFCPSAHLGSFVSYILYPPDLIVYFGAPELLSRVGAGGAAPEVAGREGADGSGVEREAGETLASNGLLEALRALADPTRLRVLELLGEDELYAQEIVGRLGIAQSAVSRHLSMLERAGLVTVRPRRGMKYYALDADRLETVAATLRSQGRRRRVG